MTIPPWRSPDKEDQRALTRFIIAELDRLDAAQATSATPEQVEWMQAIVGLNNEARRIGVTLNLPQTTAEELPDFDRAAIDVLRTRALFQLHWRKRNRTMPPLAEEIAAERWELSAADTAKLIDKFQRKTAVSQR